MIIDEYMEYEEKYRKKYGENTIILIQVGSFFELYSINENCPFMYKIGDICNIQISRKNKSIKEVSKNNPLMAGFPLYVVNKFIQILLNNKFTVVLIEQTTPPPNPERKITEIISPSTNINTTSKKGNYIMVFYFEQYDNLLVVGISGVDLTTGKTFVYENGTSKNDPLYTLDECYRLMTTYNPCEILLLSNKIDERYKNQILDIININSLIHKKWDDYELHTYMNKLDYQNKILEKAFKNRNESMLSIIEYLNLEKCDIGRLSFCCLLQFAYEHNTDIIKELDIPELIENSKILTIEYNSSIQLNIISQNDNDKPLLDILNRCSTAFGSRAFRERLLNPINNKQELNKRYDKIEELIKDDKYKFIYKHLNQINDLERVIRRILLKKLNPCEWNAIITSLENAIEAFKLVNDNGIVIKEIEGILKDLSILDLDECNKYNLGDMKTNIFKEGYLPEIDNYMNIYKLHLEKLNEINNKISNLSSTIDTSSKLEFNEKDGGYYISITKKRYENAMGINKSFMNSFDKKVVNTSNSNLYKLSSNEIIESSSIIEKQIGFIQEKVINEYLTFLEVFMNKKESLMIIIQHIKDLDIHTCNARNAVQYCYYKPSIDMRVNESYLNIQNLRHPIIERISNNVEYIGNDVDIKQSGILLFGINASGKSSFMKAIGLSLIMAQAGMYVPATSFIYHPYNHIMTRICGNDNIYRGMSSFVVEMTELRNILQRADKSSLIIGDEICCGTEAISGISIVSSAINELIEKKASFIFTSHLHELTNISIIKDKINKNLLKIYHIHITIDGDRIIYERKLKEGQGSNVYGIDVCKSLDMPIEFMKNAEFVRKEIEGINNYFINTKQSYYNSKIYMDLCEVCKKNKAFETHHINYQMMADENGKMTNFHKNENHNLIPICVDCHKKEHNGEIGIIGYKQTNKGILLEVDNKRGRIYKLIKKDDTTWYYRKKISDKYQIGTEKEIIDIYNKITKSRIDKISDEMEKEFYQK
jgi:DNA mismatch repair protein MutS